MDTLEITRPNEAAVSRSATAQPAALAAPPNRASIRSGAGPLGLSAMPCHDLGQRLAEKLDALLKMTAGRAGSRHAEIRATSSTASTIAVRHHRSFAGQELLDQIGDTVDIAQPDRMVATGKLHFQARTLHGARELPGALHRDMSVLGPVQQGAWARLWTVVTRISTAAFIRSWAAAAVGLAESRSGARCPPPVGECTIVGSTWRKARRVAPVPQAASVVSMCVRNRFASITASRKLA